MAFFKSPSFRESPPYYELVSVFARTLHDRRPRPLTIWPGYTDRGHARVDVYALGHPLGSPRADQTGIMSLLA